MCVHNFLISNSVLHLHKKYTANLPLKLTENLCPLHIEQREGEGKCDGQGEEYKGGGGGYEGDGGGGNEEQLFEVGVGGGGNMAVE